MSAKLLQRCFSVVVVAGVMALVVVSLGVMLPFPISSWWSARSLLGPR